MLGRTGRPYVPIWAGKLRETGATEQCDLAGQSREPAGRDGTNGFHSHGRRGRLGSRRLPLITQLRLNGG